MTIGYTAGVFDLFHVGHLNLLKNAKGMCDKLVVGVTTDDLVTYKGKHAMIPFEDRLEIVRSIRFVDAVVPQSDMDKLTMCKPWPLAWQKYEDYPKKSCPREYYFQMLRRRALCSPAQPGR